MKKSSILIKINKQYLLTSIFLLFSLIAIFSHADENKNTPIYCCINKLQEKYKDINIYTNSFPKVYIPRTSFLYLNASEYNELESYLKLFNEEFSKYPQSFIKKSGLEHIVFVKNLKKEGKKTGSVYFENSKIILFDVLYTNRRPMYQRHVIHHELFHYFESAFREDENWYLTDWNDVNKRGIYHSKNDPTQAFGKNADRDYKVDFPKPGFVSTYSLISLEEEKAELFAVLLLQARYEQFKQKLNEDNILKEKVKRLKKSLFSIDSSFNEQYWQELEK